MAFYLGSKFGGRVLSFLNQDAAVGTENFLPDDKLYGEIKQIIATSGQKFDFHEVMSGNKVSAPIKIEPVVAIPVATSIKPVAEAPKPPVKPEIKAEVIKEEAAKPDTVADIIDSARPVEHYRLQIGSYADRNRAVLAERQWLDRGYAVEIIETSIPGKGRWFRLHLGGFTSRGEAINEQQKLMQHYHQTAMVLSQ